MMERYASRTIDFLEHFGHVFNVIVIQKPCLWILLVLFKRNPKRVGNVDCLAVILAEQDTNYPLVGDACARSSMVI